MIPFHIQFSFAPFSLTLHQFLFYSGNVGIPFLFGGAERDRTSFCQDDRVPNYTTAPQNSFSLARAFTLNLSPFSFIPVYLIQVYLPTRNSQLMDVITNIMGALLGVIIFYFSKLRSFLSSPCLI